MLSTLVDTEKIEKLDASASKIVLMGVLFVIAEPTEESARWRSVKKEQKQFPSALLFCDFKHHFIKIYACGYSDSPSNYARQ